MIAHERASPGALNDGAARGQHDDVMPSGPKDVLKNYLQDARDTLIWKLDGLSERDQRLPRTPTGMESSLAS
jgi:hypothetical protein